MRPAILHVVLSALLGTALCFNPSWAERVVAPGLGVQYDRGINSSVAVNRHNIVVEVHESQSTDTVWYHVGRASGFGVDWSESENLGDGVYTSGAHYHSKGHDPSVAVTDDNFVVVVYRYDYNCGSPCIRPEHDLYYRVGHIDPVSLNVDWSSRTRYGNESCTYIWGILVPGSCSGGGETPQIAVNSHGTLVEVHESPQRDQLYYKVGQIDDQGNVSWGSGRKIGNQGGDFPDVAISNDGVVVEVHEEGWWSFDLWSNTGIVEGDRIVWKKNQQYSNGSAPSVAINELGMVVEAHKSETAVTDDLWFTTFAVDPDFKLSRQHNARRFENGAEPSVALNDELVVITHAEGVFEFGLASTASLIADRSRWMEQTPGLLDRQLWQITLPGTHDSAMYDMTLDACGTSPVMGPEYDVPPALAATIPGRWMIWNGAQTQFLSFKEQLEQGVRYFDLRPVSGRGDYVTTCSDSVSYGYHGMHEVLGPEVYSILDDVYDYMVSLGPNGKELAIIAITQQPEQSGFDHEDFMDLILSHPIEQFLLKGPKENLFSKTLGEIVANGPRVLIKYNDMAAGMAEQGLWSRIGPGNIYNKYTNTTSYKTMKSSEEEGGQLAKLAVQYGHPNRLFALSWTLTGKIDELEAMVAEFGNLHNMTTNANRYLGPIINNVGRDDKINIIYVDFPEDARAADVAIELNANYPEVDLAVSGPSATIVANPGDTETLRFLVTNNTGPVAEDVWLYFTLPELVTFVSVQPDDPTTMRCDVRGNDIACELGNIALGNAVGVDLTIGFDQPILTNFDVQARSAWADDPDYTNNGTRAMLAVREATPARKKSGGGVLSLWMILALASVSMPYHLFQLKL